MNRFKLSWSEYKKTIRKKGRNQYVNVKTEAAKYFKTREMMFALGKLNKQLELGM